MAEAHIVSLCVRFKHAYLCRHHGHHETTLLHVSSFQRRIVLQYLCVPRGGPSAAGDIRASANTKVMGVTSMALSMGHQCSRTFPLWMSTRPAAGRDVSSASILSFTADIYATGKGEAGGRLSVSSVSTPLPYAPP